MYGLDYLGIGHRLWPIETTIKTTPLGFAIGAFDGVSGDAQFGDAIPALRKLLSSGKFPALRVHIYYTRAHVIAPIDLMKRRVPLYEKLAKEFPHVVIYLSHTCEYDCSDGAALKQRVALIQKLAPHCIPVNSKWKGASMDGILEETHTWKRRKAPYICSTDGLSLPQGDALSYVQDNSKATIIFGWASRFNGRDATDPLPPPKDRTAWPDAKYITAITRCLDRIPPAPAPTFQKKVLPFKPPLIWKTLGEDFPGDKDPRDNKPAFLGSGLTASVLSVVDRAGREVCTLGLYPKSNARYYSGCGSRIYGYEMADIATRQSGSPWVWIMSQKGFYGPIHPTFRWGSFRDA